MKRENAILRWLLYLAVFGFVVALTLPLFGPGVSYAEAAKVAFPCGFFTLTLYGYLVRQGEMQLWVPSLGFVVGAIGVVLLLGGPTFAGLLELPIAERADQEKVRLEDIAKFKEDLAQAASPEARKEIEEEIAFREEQDGWAEDDIASFREYQQFGGIAAGVGLVLLVISQLLPRREKSPETAEFPEE